MLLGEKVVCRMRVYGRGWGEERKGNAFEWIIEERRVRCGFWGVRIMGRGRI